MTSPVRKLSNNARNFSSLKNKSDNHDLDEEVVASSAGSEEHNVTEEDCGGEHNENDSFNVREENANLFADSKSGTSTINNLVTNKRGTKTVSYNKRKADNDDDNTDNGKKQKGNDEE